MRLQVHPGDEIPIYRQIVRQITDALVGGQLRAGDKLPSHRELSEELAIAPLTVKKAYDELERLGILTLSRGRGTFVAERPPQPDPKAHLEGIRDSARRLLSRAALGGVSFPEVLRILKEVRKEMDR